jgi:hypothetical protein
MHKHIKPFNQYINESYTEYEEEQLGKDFSDEFGYRAYSNTYSTSGRISIQTRSDIDPETFSKMIQWVEDQGYKVDMDQSYPDFDYDDDRYWYPRIQFSKSISDEEMDRMTKIQMDHDEDQLRREQGF